MTQPNRMSRRLIVAGLCASLALPAAAQSVKLRPAEITALLQGNTAVGLWDGVPYRQYFGADGVTIFAQPGLARGRGALGISKPLARRHRVGGLVRDGICRPVVLGQQGHAAHAL